MEERQPRREVFDWEVEWPEGRDEPPGATHPDRITDADDTPDADADPDPLPES